MILFCPLHYKTRLIDVTLEVHFVVYYYCYYPLPTYDLQLDEPYQNSCWQEV